MAILWSGCSCSSSGVVGGGDRTDGGAAADAGDGGASCVDETDCAAGEVCVGGACRRAEVGVDAGPCREVSGESTIAPIPVDIIIAIDNSGSMTEEAAEVRRNINNFAGIIAESGLDYRVVLISRPDGSNGVCVVPPLGSGPPDCVSGEEGRLLAIHVGVASRNAPNLVLSHYETYRPFLREDAAKIFLWITDDESGTYTADSFRTALEALEPAGMFANTIHNAIVGYYGDTDWSNRSAGSCPSLARVGAIYLRLANCLRDDGTLIEGCTPGQQARVCETDWTAIFEDIARGVVAGVPVVCEFAVPDPPDGFTLDLDMIGVTYRSGATVRMDLRRVDGPDSCTGDGWYFDDPTTPTEIILCPELCRTVQADPDARMDIALGCFPDLM